MPFSSPTLHIMSSNLHPHPMLPTPHSPSMCFASQLCPLFTQHIFPYPMLPTSSILPHPVSPFHLIKINAHHIYSPSSLHTTFSHPTLFTPPRPVFLTTDSMFLTSHTHIYAYHISHSYPSIQCTSYLSPTSPTPLNQCSSL